MCLRCPWCLRCLQCPWCLRCLECLCMVSEVSMVPEVPGVSTPQYLILFCYPQLLHSCTITEPIATSDHLSVLVQLSSSNRPPKVKPTRKKMLIHKAANTELALDLFSSLFKQSCVNESWSVCKSKFWSVIHATIPSKTVPIRGNLPWLSREISR